MNDLPSQKEIQTEADPIRRAILAAIVRVLEQRPLRARPGDASVLAVSQEADVKRHWLNGRHRDLRDRFVFLRDRADELTSLEVSLTAQLELANSELERLKSRVRDLTEDRDNWRATGEIFLRAMNVQEREIDKRQVENARLTRDLERLRDSGSHDELSERRHRRP